MNEAANPFTVRDGEVFWRCLPLTPEAAEKLLAIYAAEPLTFPGRAAQLRAAMAEAYQKQEAA